MLTRLFTLCLPLTLINVAVADKPEATTLPIAVEATIETNDDTAKTKAVVETNIVPEVPEDKAPQADPACAQLDGIQQNLRQQSANIEIQGRALTDKEFEQLGRHHSARFHLARAKSALGCASK